MAHLLPRLDDLTVDQIKDTIDEYNHQLFHLERSQKELKVYLDEDPDDRDLKTAYEENIDVIERRKDMIVIMIKYLEENVPFFEKSMATANLNSSLPTTTVGSVTASVQSLTVDDQDQEEDEDDRGMYA